MCELLQDAAWQRATAALDDLLQPSQNAHLLDATSSCCKRRNQHSLASASASAAAGSGSLVWQACGASATVKKYSTSEACAVAAAAAGTAASVASAAAVAGAAVKRDWNSLACCASAAGLAILARLKRVLERRVLHTPVQLAHASVAQAEQQLPKQMSVQPHCQQVASIHLQLLTPTSMHTNKCAHICTARTQRPAAASQPACQPAV